MAARASENDTISAPTAAGNALSHAAELITGKPAVVTSLEPDADRWLVEVEVLEERRIPPSSDLLALYELELDPAGDLLAYRLARRYTRDHTNVANDTDSDDGASTGAGAGRGERRRPRRRSPARQPRRREHSRRPAERRRRQVD